MRTAFASHEDVAKSQICWAGSELSSLRAPSSADTAERHVHPVIGRIVRVLGELARAAVGKRPVGRAACINQCMQRRIIHPACGEGSSVHAVVPHGTVIRRHVHRIRRDCHRIGEIHLLPPRGRLVGERRRSQQRARAGPQITHVCPCVIRALVKPNPRDKAVDV